MFHINICLEIRKKIIGKIKFPNKCIERSINCSVFQHYLCIIFLVFDVLTSCKSIKPYYVATKLTQNKLQWTNFTRMIPGPGDYVRQGNIEIL